MDCLPNALYQLSKKEYTWSEIRHTPFSLPMSSPIEEIKARLDIVELIGQYVRLQKAGSNFRALCPFHTEKTPSFFVSPTRQTWHCFGGCGRGGDIFKFIMEIEGHDFPEALRLLAGRAGVSLRREDPAIQSERNLLYEINEEAARIFEQAFAATPAARRYMAERGVSAETIKNFRIGFAPKSWDFVIKNMSQRRYRIEDVVKSGLALRSEDGSSFYDRFRSRIIFPITDASGRVIGFGGRIFEVPSSNPRLNRGQVPSSTSEAKYINTPQTLVYDKSRALYGFDKAKQDIRVKNQVVVVEGYMDCVMSHQAGIANTVAVSGTALTPQQLQSVRRLCDTLITSFDTDSAGDAATKRSLALAAQFGFERKIVAIPSGKDPADTVAENPDAWQKAVARAQPTVQFFFEKAFREHNPKTAEGKKAIALLALPYIRDLVDEIEKAHWVGEMARGLAVPEEAVRKAIARAGSGPVLAPEKIQEKDQTRRTRREQLEENLLVFLCALDQEARQEALRGRHLRFDIPLHQTLFRVLAAGAETSAGVPETDAEIELLRFKSEVLRAELADPDAEFRVCLRELEKATIREDLENLAEAIAKKEHEGDQGVVTTLLQDFHALSSKLKIVS